MTYEFTEAFPTRDDGIETWFRFGEQQSFEQSDLFLDAVVVQVSSGFEQRYISDRGGRGSWGRLGPRDKQRGKRERAGVGRMEGRKGCEGGAYERALEGEGQRSRGERA